MRFVMVLVSVVALLGAIVFGIALYVSAPVFDERLPAAPAHAFEVLPTEVALTFARTHDRRPLLVVAADAESVEAVDLASALGTAVDDPLKLLDAHGYEAIASAATGPGLRVALTQLGLPFDPAYPHIAAGTNFRAHAEEVGLDDGPFLFPKLSRATAWNAPVPAQGRLDYEAELCAVTLTAYATGAPAPFGYVLCNDFTDRWQLLAEIDLDTPMGRSGFADAKGGAGMLPVGPFLVVPRRADGFHDELEIGLAVNAELRQRDMGGLMIWSPGEIARNTLAQCEAPFVSTAGEHRLTPCDAIPEATLLLTGTPAGVAFHYLNVWRASSYLRPGDRVLTYGQHLGMLANRVE